MRGNRRQIVGRVTPGDDVEVSREIERLWEWHMSLDRLLKRIRRILTGPDGLPETFDDLDASFGGGRPFDGIRQKPQTSSHTVSGGSMQAVPIANWARLELDRYNYWFSQGWRIAARIICQSEGPHVGFDIVSDDETTSHLGVYNFTTGTGLEYPGGWFDSGWIVYGDGVASADPGTSYDPAKVVVAHNHSLGPNSTISNGVIYVQWILDTESVVTIGSGDVGDHAMLDLYKSAATPVTKTSNFSFTSTDDFVQVNASGGVVTGTLPNLPVPADNGRIYIVKKIDSSPNAVTISRFDASDSIDGAASVSLTVQHETVILIADSPNATYRIVGWYP